MKVSDWIVDEWHKAWKWATVQLSVGFMVLSQAYDYFPWLKENLSSFISSKAMFVIGAVFFVARMFTLAKKNESSST